MGDIPLAPPDVTVPVNGQFAKGPQRSKPFQVEEREHEKVENYDLGIWTSLSPGDVVSLRGLDIHDCVGIVESRTTDGLIIWIRDDLNERKLFHFQDVQSVEVVP